jgi:hypothetical protein
MLIAVISFLNLLFYFLLWFIQVRYCILIHIVSLMLQGLWDKREIDIESTEDATDRIIKYLK